MPARVARGRPRHAHRQRGVRGGGLAAERGGGRRGGGRAVGGGGGRAVDGGGRAVDGAKGGGRAVVQGHARRRARRRRARASSAREREHSMGDKRALGTGRFDAGAHGRRRERGGARENASATVCTKGRRPSKNKMGGLETNHPPRRSTNQHPCHAAAATPVVAPREAAAAPARRAPLVADAPSLVADASQLQGRAPEHGGRPLGRYEGGVGAISNPATNMDGHRGRQRRSKRPL